MSNDKTLRDAMLDTVLNQINTNDPPAARDTYDRLIDEREVNGGRRKERWSVAEADLAVRQTVDAAAFLSERRVALAPRSLILGVQAQLGAQVSGDGPADDPP